MNEDLPICVRWPQNSFLNHPLDAETMSFLSAVGLPEFVPGMTLEFGLFDSDGQEFVIGEDDGFAIYIDPVSNAVFVEDESAVGRCFINSSVRLLSLFIEAIVFASPRNSGTWNKELKAKLQPYDPVALDDSAHCLWPAIIDRFELNLS